MRSELDGEKPCEGLDYADSENGRYWARTSDPQLVDLVQRSRQFADVSSNSIVERNPPLDRIIRLRGRLRQRPYVRDTCHSETNDHARRAQTRQRRNRPPAIWSDRRERGKNGKDQRSFGFAQAFGRGVDSAQPCCLSARQRTDANGCTKSTSWGSLVRAQYRPSKFLQI